MLLTLSIHPVQLKSLDSKNVGSFGFKTYSSAYYNIATILLKGFYNLFSPKDQWIIVLTALYTVHGRIYSDYELINNTQIMWAIYI